MNKNIFLGDFFCFSNKPLLKTLNLLNKLICLWISALKLAPSMHIEWLFKLVFKEFRLLLLLKQFLVKHEDLSAKVRDAGSLVLRDDKQTLKISNLILDSNDFFNLLLVVDLTFIQSRLLNLNLLIKNLEFLITLDQLSTKDVTFVNDHLVVLPLLLLLLFRLGDDVLKTGNVALLSANHLITRVYLLTDLLDVAFELCVFPCILCLRCGFCCNRIVFGLDLLFELIDLLGHSLELHLQLCNLFLCLEKILRVKVSVRANSFIEVLLLLKSSLSLNVFLLKLGDEVVLKLNLL